MACACLLRCQGPPLLSAPAGCVLQEAMLADEALPQQPSSLHRSPSVEELLRKVQCVDARQVGLPRGRRGRPVHACSCMRSACHQLSGAPNPALPALCLGARAGQDWRGRVWRGVPGGVPHLRPGGGQVDQAHQGAGAGGSFDGLGDGACWLQSLRSAAHGCKRGASCTPAHTAPRRWSATGPPSGTRRS